MFGQLLAQLARELKSLGFPYMVIGGQAVLIHGEPRFTRDIDVTLGTNPESLPRLLKAILTIGWKPLPSDPVSFVQETLVLPCEDPKTGIRLDFIFGLTAYEMDAISRSIPIFFEGVPVQVASMEDLVISKIIAGRPRDLEDVMGILAKNPQLNKKMASEILANFGRELNEPLAERFEEIWNKSRQ